MTTLRRLFGDTFKQHGKPVRVFDPRRVFMLPDHSIPAYSVEVAEGVDLTESFGRECGLKVYRVGDGIEHVVLIEDGHISGGPYGAPNQNPWGLRRVVTTAVADGAPIVGAFREGATLWRRGGMTIEASNSHSDYFRRNLTALRCEERLAVTVFRNAAFQVVSSAS